MDKVLEIIQERYDKNKKIKIEKITMNKFLYDIYKNDAISVVLKSLRKASDKITEIGLAKNYVLFGDPGIGKTTALINFNNYILPTLVATEYIIKQESSEYLKENYLPDWDIIINRLNTINKEKTKHVLNKEKLENPFLWDYLNFVLNPEGFVPVTKFGEVLLKAKEKGRISKEDVPEEIRDIVITHDDIARSTPAPESTKYEISLNIKFKDRVETIRYSWFHLSMSETAKMLSSVTYIKDKKRLNPNETTKKLNQILLDRSKLSEDMASAIKEATSLIKSRKNLTQEEIKTNITVTNYIAQIIEDCSVIVIDEFNRVDPVMLEIFLGPFSKLKNKLFVLIGNIDDKVTVSLKKFRKLPTAMGSRVRAYVIEKDFEYIPPTLYIFKERLFDKIKLAYNNDPDKAEDMMRRTDARVMEVYKTLVDDYGLTTRSASKIFTLINAGVDPDELAFMEKMPLAKSRLKSMFDIMDAKSTIDEDKIEEVTGVKEESTPKTTKAAKKLETLLDKMELRNISKNTSIRTLEKEAITMERFTSKILTPLVTHLLNKGEYDEPIVLAVFGDYATYKTLGTTKFFSFEFPAYYLNLIRKGGVTSKENQTTDAQIPRSQILNFKTVLNEYIKNLEKLKENLEILVAELRKAYSKQKKKLDEDVKIEGYKNKVEKLIDSLTLVSEQRIQRTEDYQTIAQRIVAGITKTPQQNNQQSAMSQITEYVLKTISDVSNTLNNQITELPQNEKIKVIRKRLDEIEEEFRRYEELIKKLTIRLLRHEMMKGIVDEFTVFAGGRIVYRWAIVSLSEAQSEIFKTLVYPTDKNTEKDVEVLAISKIQKIIENNDIIIFDEFNRVPMEVLNVMLKEFSVRKDKLFILLGNPRGAETGLLTPAKLNKAFKDRIIPFYVIHQSHFRPKEVEEFQKIYYTTYLNRLKLMFISLNLSGYEILVKGLLNKLKIDKGSDIEKEAYEILDSNVEIHKKISTIIKLMTTPLNESGEMIKNLQVNIATSDDKKISLEARIETINDYFEAVSSMATKLFVEGIEKALKTNERFRSETLMQDEATGGKVVVEIVNPRILEAVFSKMVDESRAERIKNWTIPKASKLVQDAYETAKITKNSIDNIIDEIINEKREYLKELVTNVSEIREVIEEGTSARVVSREGGETVWSGRNIIENTLNTIEVDLPINVMTALFS